MSAYAFTLLATFFDVISYDAMIVVINILFTIMVITIIIVLTFSLLKIRNFTKMLKANKVFANEWLMAAHLIFFCATFAFYINCVIILARLMDTDYTDYDEK